MNKLVTRVCENCGHVGADVSRYGGYLGCDDVKACHSRQYKQRNAQRELEQPVREAFTSIMDDNRARYLNLYDENMKLHEQVGFLRQQVQELKAEVTRLKGERVAA